jgi:hypothetical protein
VRVLEDADLRRLLLRSGQVGLAESLDVGTTANLAATTVDPNDPSTWPPTQIVDERVVASYDPVPHVYAFMRYNGMAGEITLTANLSDSTGRIVEPFGPDTKYDLNFGAMNFFKAMQHSVEFHPATTCGTTISASAIFRSYNFLLPFPAKLGPLTLPRWRYGLSQSTGSGGAVGPDCRTETQPPGGDGDGGGSNGPTRYRVCFYLDWYFANGEFWYTETVSCVDIEMDEQT